MKEWERLKQVHLDDQHEAHIAALSRYFVWVQKTNRCGVPSTPMLVDECTTLEEAISIMEDIRDGALWVAVQYLGQTVAHATKDELVINGA